MKQLLKSIRYDYYSYVIYQGQQDKYKHPFHERIIPTIEFIIINLIGLPIVIFARIYIKLFV